MRYGLAGSHDVLRHVYFILQVIAIGREHEAVIPNLGLHPWCADAPAIHSWGVMKVQNTASRA